MMGAKELPPLYIQPEQLGWRYSSSLCHWVSFSYTRGRAVADLIIEMSMKGLPTGPKGRVGGGFPRFRPYYPPRPKRRDSTPDPEERAHCALEVLPPGPPPVRRSTVSTSPPRDGFRGELPSGQSHISLSPGVRERFRAFTRGFLASACSRFRTRGHGYLPRALPRRQQR